ncbi:MAG TPA: hypothetical protein VGX48_17075 [Pyrinomonadaceae bacterium]|jgi:hypothetical protein|nr:hypothetical protein [Pyrinomonadaceae bacterium]
MLALLFLLGALLLGVGLTRRAVRGLLSGAEVAMWGVVVGWMAAALFAYGLARWQGRLSFGLMAWASAGVWVAAVALWLSRRPRVKWGESGAWLRENAVLLFVLALFAPVYVFLFSTHTLLPGEGGVYSGGSAWADMSFHAALATSFAYGENFPPVYTPLPPEPLLYPFMPDFQAGALVAAGLSLRAALLLTAIPLALCVTGLFYQFALRLAGTRGAAALSTILFLLGGGLGFAELPRDWLRSGKGFLEFWNALPVNYANAWERGLHWNNVVTDTFLPQRTSLFGMTAALIIFTLFAEVWRRRHEGEGGEPGAARLLLTGGVLAGVLPLFHAHTYAAVVFVSIILFALRPRRAWLAFWAPALLLAAPQLFGLASHVSGGGFVRLLPGWMGHDAPSFTVYLLRNFGLPLVLAVPAWLAAPRAWRGFYLPFVLLFAFALVVMFSPNTFDNAKVIYYWHAVNSAFVGSLIFRLAAEYRQRLLASLLALVCVASGLTALQNEGLKRELLFSDEELAAADFAREHTPPRSLFLAAPSLNHPVLSLAGRRVVRGPTFWPWSHGYEFRSREADVRRIYGGTRDAVELLRHYGVDYVYLGEVERRELGADQAFFDNNFEVVYSGAGVRVYAVGGAPGAAEPPPRELAPRVGRDPYALLEEFPRAGFYVYRLYRTSYGRPPRMNEFMKDMRTLGHGLYVGGPGWEARLEENRRTLLEDWTAREEFGKAYEGKTGAEIVDALLTNTGIGMDAGGRELLARSLDSGASKTSEVLERIAEDRGVRAREYDAAYVLVHFFAYLGRDPDAPPDRDLSGFRFWLDSLRRTGDHRALSRAFLESQEYKQRRPQ